MALIKWQGQDVWEPFRDLEEDLNRINRLFPVLEKVGGNGGKAWSPDVDVTEEKDRILVRADLPGVKQEDISVELSEGMLTIKGERKHEAETKEGKTYRLERSYGSFLRSFTVPAGVDPAKVEATYKNGVLEIALAKRAEAKAKQIKVT